MAVASQSCAALGAALLLLSSCSLPEFEFEHGASDSGLDGAGGSSASGGSGGGNGGTSASSGTGGGSASGGGGTGGVGPSCTTHADCADSGVLDKCHPPTQTCVLCLPGPDDDCPSGQFCKVVSAGTVCAPGCKASSECFGTLTCADGKCVGCASDGNCPLGKLCNTATTECDDGCTATHGCQPGFTCCPGTDGTLDPGSCKALSLDKDNCGECGKVCPAPEQNGSAKCEQNKCGVACPQIQGRWDCNGIVSDGCEANLYTDPNTCGACNKQCAAGQICDNQICKDP
jgi:hypothetical protein